MRKTIGAQVSNFLKNKGVEVIFGIPGVHNQELYRGIEEAGIKHILARHEQGAGFMADGYARATGLPGVAYVITGPGVCNIMTPMGQAYSDSIPMLVISSSLEEIALEPGRGRLHEMKDQRLAAETVCDWSVIAKTEVETYELIDRAFREFQTQRKRPKHIQLPISLLESLSEVDCIEVKDKMSPNEIEISQSLQFINELFNEFPKILFIFGGGACHCSDLAREVMKKCNAASFSTFAGRGIIKSGNKLNFGSYLSHQSSIAPISEADIVIAVGTSLSECDIWRESLGVNGKFIWVNSDPEAFSSTVGHHQKVICKSEDFLESFCDKIPINYPNKWDIADIANFKIKCEIEVDSLRPGIVPICHALRDCTDENTMFFSDMTQFAYVAKEVIPMDRPNLWHHPYGFGTLGYALPAAIGGAVGQPNIPVIVIAGDYGFQYTLQELATAVELRLSIPIVLWDNHKLKEIEDSMVSAQIAPNAVKAFNPDFCQLATAYGASSAAPKDISEFKVEVVKAFSRELPTLIYLSTDFSVSNI